GSVYRRRSDGRWVASASLGTRDGRRRRRGFYGATAEEAISRRAGFLRDLGDGYERPAGRSDRAGDWLAYWLDHVCTASEPTRIGDESAIRRHPRPPPGPIPPARPAPGPLRGP